MPARILGEAGGFPEAVRGRQAKTPSEPLPAHRPLSGRPGAPFPVSRLQTRLTCPSCGSSHVAQMLGDNGGISYVCTACGHSWS